MIGWVSRQRLLSGAMLSKVRLYSGLALLLYVVPHFYNHALGLVSLELMEGVGDWFNAFWRFWPTTVLLYGALAIHTVTALTRFVQRQSLSLSAAEWMQLVMGVAIPFLLLSHVIGTRWAASAYDINASYTYVLLSTFVFSPISGVLNALGLVAAWTHGCIGVHYWLRLKSWYSPYQGWFIAHAVALPLLALGGYLSAGRYVIPLAGDGDFMGEYYENLNLTSDAVFTLISRDDRIAYVLVTAAALAVILLHVTRRIMVGRGNNVKIEYMDGPVTRQPIGPTLLEMSRLAGVPHASVCGGKGRCSTCRVQIVSSDAQFDAPSESELRVLKRVGVKRDVRLACQIRPSADLKVLRLLPSDVTMASAASVHPWSTGQEKEIVVMFADLRDFTRTSEARLPFDVVYLINQFSRVMGQTVERHGGRIDKFLGDGFMALFGVEASPEEAASQALAAAEEMLTELEEMNNRLAGDLDEPLRMGIGMHSGSVVLGDMGYGASRHLTAIGDTVNTSSRLEAMTKELGCAVCVSAHLVKLAGLTPSQSLAKNVSVRGKANEMKVFAIRLIGELKSDDAAMPRRDTEGESENV